MRLRPNRSAAENARRVLPFHATNFFQAGDAALEKSKPAEVHKFRIRTKRFRYELEYFSPCYGQAHGTYLDLLKDLQATLGALNDCTASRQLLGEILQLEAHPRRDASLFQAMIRREAHLLEEFRELWRQKFSSVGLRQRWTRYLSQPPARRPKRRASPG